MAQISIIAHRAKWCSNFGLFEDKTRQNTIFAFEAAFRAGYSVETDLRHDQTGEIIISHDPASQTVLTLDSLFALYCQFDRPGTLALNIKADGLADQLHILLNKYDITDFFTFDMSIPEHLSYIKSGLNPYIRQSEYEPNAHKTSPFLYQTAMGIWLDQFAQPNITDGQAVSWINIDIMGAHLKLGKSLALVSPELHPWGRRIKDKLYQPIWAAWREDFKKLHQDFDLSKISICTDFPDEANQFFNQE